MVKKVGFAFAPPYVDKSDTPARAKTAQVVSARPQDEIPFVLRDNGVLWLTVPGVHKNTLAIKPLRIEASPEAVWSLVKRIDRYAEFSSGQVEAHMKNAAPLASGNQIDLSLKMDLDPIKRLIFGGQLAKSEETVVLDETTMALGWHRKVPLSCGAESERWQIVVPRGNNVCEYYSGLYIPGLTGKIAMVSVGDEILEAFESVARGIKSTAEK